MARKCNPKISVCRTQYWYKKPHPRREKHNKNQEMGRRHGHEVYHRVPTKCTESIWPTRPPVHRFENPCPHDDEDENCDLWGSGQGVWFKERMD